MSSVLSEICEKKRLHVEKKKQETPLSVLKDLIKTAPPAISFSAALHTQAQKSTAIIAEVKKASPSKGIIRSDFNPAEIAKAYENHGAACISVLTDEPYFQGHDEYFKAVRGAVNLPLLRKDFMIDPYQIYESRVMGADCILLIMAALSDDEAQELYDLSLGLGMEALIEVHDSEECARAIKLSPLMIGVNNRNLKTLSVDIETSRQLAKEIPHNIIKISESGLESPQTLKALKKNGYSGFLIGESLMRQVDIGQALKELIIKSV